MQPGRVTITVQKDENLPEMQAGRGRDLQAVLTEEELQRVAGGEDGTIFTVDGHGTGAGSENAVDRLLAQGRLAAAWRMEVPNPL